MWYNIVMDKKGIKTDEKGKFVKGTAPGPGRPKGSISIKDQIRKKLLEDPARFDELVEFYMKEEAPAMRKLLWEMLEGKPKESVDAVIRMPKPIMEIDAIQPNDSNQEDSEPETED